MDYVRRILGEADEDEPKKKKKDEPGKAEPKAPEKPAKEAPNGEETLETEVSELANLWNTGNKDDLLRRFLEMDNETAVKVVFAIGREGALELARMADQEALVGAEGGVEGTGEATTEPVSVEGPGAETGSIRDIMGTENAATQEPDLRQFRQDRAASPAGEAVRQELGIR